MAWQHDAADRIRHHLRAASEEARRLGWKETAEHYAQEESRTEEAAAAFTRLGDWPED